MQRTVGIHQGEKAVNLGKLFKPQEALKIDLVDQVVPQDQLMDVARQEMKQWLQIPCKQISK